jgi:hypothetical protein
VSHVEASTIVLVEKHVEMHPFFRGAITSAMVIQHSIILARHTHALILEVTIALKFWAAGTAKDVATDATVVLATTKHRKWLSTLTAAGRGRVTCPSRPITLHKRRRVEPCKERSLLNILEKRIHVLYPGLAGC